MPLAGILCDDKKFKGEKFSFEECLACSKARGPRKCHNTFQNIKMTAMNGETRKNAGFSTTMVTQKCARKVILSMEEDFWEAPSQVWPRNRGTIHHILVEQFSEGLEPYFAEVRCQRAIMVDGIEFVLTGKPDMVLVDQKLILDYKSVGEIESEWKTITNGRPEDEHTAQVNIYRWIVADGVAVEDSNPAAGGITIKKGERVAFEIEQGAIHYLDMKQQWSCAAPIWTLEQTEQYIIDHLRPHAHYKKTGELPPVITNLWGERHIFCDAKYCALREVCDARGGADEFE